MKIQSDSKLRVVALSNLEAMCERQSGTCHRYSIAKVTPNRVYIEYSNPDEWGNEHPMQAVFPAWQDMSTSFVALSILKVHHDSWDGEGWQAFQTLLDCPELFRSNPDSNDWKSREEWENQKQTA